MKVLMLLKSESVPSVDDFVKVDQNERDVRSYLDGKKQCENILEINLKNNVVQCIRIRTLEAFQNTMDELQKKVEKNIDGVGGDTGKKSDFGTAIFRRSDTGNGGVVMSLVEVSLVWLYSCKSAPRQAESEVFEKYESGAPSRRDALAANGGASD